MQSCRRNPSLVLIIMVLLSSACFWKKKGPEEVKIQDVYGTVESIDQSSLVINAKGASMQFDMTDSSIKGSEFGSGAYVHVYYRVKDDHKEVTMVVEKVDH